MASNGDDVPADPFCNPDSPVKVTFEDVKSAYERIKSGILNTPCILSNTARLSGINIYLKMENLQQTGSFKERGARNSMLKLSDEEKKKGIVAASLGNHSQGVSFHGHDLGIPVTVVMPVTAPIMKIQNCRKLGANVVVQGQDMSEAKNIALKMGKEQGMAFINGYDHPDVIAGQGTVAIEILTKHPDTDVIVVPTGGGGLLSGIAVAAKALKPEVTIISVETENCASYAKAMEMGGPTLVPIDPTLADGLAVSVIGCNAWATSKGLVDKAIVVKETSVALAIVRFVEVEKCVVEGAGSCGLAAVLEGKLNEYRGKKVVLVLSGGNIDTTILGRCLFRGLAADARLVKFKLVINDRPGGICEVCTLLNSVAVTVKDVFHERTWVEGDVFSVDMTVVCETRDYAHAAELKNALTERYPHVRFINFPEPRVCASNTCKN